MNKLFTTLLLFIASANLQAQGGYVKYADSARYETQTPGRTIKVFKGEIVPCLKKGSKIDAIIGHDTIKDLPFPSKDYKIVQPVADYQPQKWTLVKPLKKDGLALASVNTADIASDTVTLIAESGKLLMQLTSIREASAELSKCGSTFRLMFTDAPSIFYDSDKFASSAESSSAETQNTEEEDWPWAYYALVFLAAGGGMGFCAWLFFKSKNNPDEYKNNPDEYVDYTGNSLSKFAEKYGGVNSLHDMNPELIPKKSDWDKIKNKTNRETMIQKKLKGKKIRIKHAAPYILKPDDANKNYEETERTDSHPQSSPKETSAQSARLENHHELVERLRKMEDAFIHEIQKLSNNQGESKKWQDDKRELEAKLERIENDKSALESNLQKANVDMNKARSEAEDIKKRMIAVDFLKDYSESVFSYLKLCQQVLNDAYGVFHLISRQNPREAFAAEHLLIKFQSAVHSIPVGDWRQILRDIKDSGATANRELAKSFSQIENEPDKKREFQRLLFSNVLVKYSSDILILAEAFKNLSRFQVSPDFANKAQRTFGNYAAEIVNKAKSAGLTIKHVPLF